MLDRDAHLLPGTEDRVTDALDAMADEVPRDGRGMGSVVTLDQRLPDAS